MFAKKLLSFVALLLVGGQISTVYGEGAATIPTCSADSYEYDDSRSYPVESYCIKNKIVYFLNSLNKYIYTIEITTGLAIFKLKSEYELLSNEIDFNDVSKLALYDCNGSTCKQTYGYLYYILEDKYIKVSHDSDSVLVTPETNGIESETDCAENVGKLIRTSDNKVYLCLSDDKSVELKSYRTGGNYFMTNVSGNIFTDDNTYSNLVIKESKEINALTFNNAYTDEEYCDYDSNKIRSRIVNFCSGTILDNLYECTNGLCNKSYSPIEKGNYIIEDDSGNSNLYVCDYDNGTSGAVHCDKAGQTLDGLIAVQDTENDEGYVIQKALDKTDLAKINEISSVKLYLYDCEDGNCQRTDGFVKYGESLSNMAKCLNNADCATVTDSDAITVTGVAVIKSTFEVEDIDSTGTTLINVAVGNNYFYYKDTDNVVLIKTVSDGETNPSHMIVGVAKYLGDSIVADTSYKVVKKCTSNSETTYTIDENGQVTAEVCVITTPCELRESDNEYCKKGYYLKITEGSTEKLADGEKNGTLYYCSTDTACGVATNVGTGLYKNNDEVTDGRPEFIKCSGEASSCTGVAVVNANDDCSTAGVGGIITYTGTYTTYKLCLTDTTSPKTILLSTTETGATTDTGSKFFISIDNEGNPFGHESGKYVLIEPNADGTIITILKNESDDKKYKYTNVSQKVRSRKDQDDVCKNGEVSGTIFEFKKDNNDNYTYENSNYLIIY